MSEVGTGLIDHFVSPTIQNYKFAVYLRVFFLNQIVENHMQLVSSWGFKENASSKHWIVSHSSS